MDIHYFIGIKIKTRRKELGLSGANLAQKLSISQQQISRYENGINKIPLNHLVSIAIALKCPIDWFFQGCITDEDFSIQDDNISIKNQELKYTAESVIVHNKKCNLILYYFLLLLLDYTIAPT